MGNESIFAAHRHQIFILLFASLLTACATPTRNGRAVLAADVCGSRGTLVCAERMGKTYKCSCQSKEALRDLFELYPE